MSSWPDTSIGELHRQAQLLGDHGGDVDVVADRVVLRIAEADGLAAQRHADAHDAARADIVEHAGRRRKGRGGDERQRGQDSRKLLHWIGSSICHAVLAARSSGSGIELSQNQ
jgi:hypothetical protein